MKGLSIKWRECHQIRAQPIHVLATLQDSIQSLDINYPRRFKITGPLNLPQTLTALRLCVKGHANNQEPLRISMHAGMQRLTLQLWGSPIAFAGPRAAFQSLTDMHVEAATVDLGQHLNEIVQERGQLTVRVPDGNEMYGDGGGRLVQVAHMGPWPPSMPGYDWAVVPEACACCYWPCACGACESCRRADFWRAPGSE